MPQALINKKNLKHYPQLKKNFRASKKDGLKVSFFDKHTKIYKAFRLTNNEVIDFTSPNEEHQMSQTDLVSLLDEFQIKGMDGSGFPTSQKIKELLTYTGRKTLVINGVECEPGLIHDSWIIKNRLSDVICGIKELCRWIAFDQVVLACKAKITQSDEKIQFRQVPPYYPLGEERMLLQHLFQAKIPPQTRPTQIGYCVLNVQTILSIYEAFCLHRRAKSRYLTAVNLTTGEARIVKADYGTKAEDILNQTFSSNETSFIGMGLFNCEKLTDQDTISAQTAFLAKGTRVTFRSTSYCLNCGHCNEVCPKGVNIESVVYADRKEMKIDKSVLSQCIFCNACTFYCRGGLNIMDSIIKTINE